MCGILVVVSRHVPVDHARFDSALLTLRHRGPDATGAQSIADKNVPYEIRLGHTRLSIVDLDPRSNQPFVRDGAALCYNGEIYNFREIQKDLATQGAKFLTSGDTEVLFEALRLIGAASLSRLQGMWAFAFLDVSNGSLLLSRDRFGKKPLFYSINESCLIIASEAKAIARYAGSALEVLDDEVCRYLRHGFLMPKTDGSTCFPNIKDVPPGGTVKIDLRSWQVQTDRIETLEYALPGVLPENNLTALVGDAVVKRLQSDRPVGLLLSGGVDSSLILSVLAFYNRLGEVKCFIGNTGTSEDVQYARACVKQLSITATEIELDYSASTFGRFLKICKHQEKPFPLIGNVMAMAEMYERISDDGVKVVLDGTGGDEVFGGYWDRYLRFAVQDAMAAGDEKWIRKTRHIFENDPWLKGLLSGVKPTITPISELTRRYCGEAILAASSGDPLDDFEGSLAEACLLDLRDGRLNEWVWQNDRNAMMCGIENRSPLLDHRLIPAIAGNLRDKFDAPFNKVALRRMFDHFTQLPTQWRPAKQGFRWTGARFLQENKSLALDLISGSKTLRRFVDSNGFVDAASRDDSLLASDLCPRLLCVAGLEAANGWSP